MGNESSAPRLHDSVPPRMLLSIDALVLPPPESPQPVVSWMEDQGKSASSAAKSKHNTAIRSDSCFVSVRLDNVELNDGKVSEFPSGPIQIDAPSWGATLEIQFFASTHAYGTRPWSALCAPISKMIRFGAPLYTSLWLGLDSLNAEPTSETRSSYSLPTTADVSLKGALDRAHVHSAPKVRISLCRPLVMHESRQNGEYVHEMAPNLDGVFHPASLDIHSQKLRESAQQVDGLIRCLDESNNLIHTCYESEMMATLRGKLVKHLQEMKARYKSAEEQFFADAEKLTLDLEQLRQQHVDTVRGHDIAIAYQRSEHADALQAKRDEWEKQRQIFEKRVKDHEGQLHLQVQEQLREIANRPGLEGVLRDMQGDMQVELAQKLSQLSEMWRSRVNEVHSEQAQQLESQREKARTAFVPQQAEIEKLASELTSLQGECVEAQLEYCNRAKREQAQREELQAQLADSVVRAERELDDHQSKADLATRSHQAESEALQASLDAHRREHERELAQAQAGHSLQHANLVAKHQAEDQRLASEATQSHQRHLQEMQAQKDEDMRRHETAYQTHQEQIEELKSDLHEKESVTRERLAEVAKWQAEVQRLSFDLNQLHDRGQCQDEERRQLVSEHQAKLDTARQAHALARLEGARSAAEKHRSHAEELHRLVETHTGTLADFQTKRDKMRAQMREVDDEATKTCDSIAQEFKTKLDNIGEAFQECYRKHVLVEDQSSEVLAAKEAEAAQKQAALDSARLSEVIALQEAIESYATATEKTHAELKDRLAAIKSKTAADEAKCIEEARQKLEEHNNSLAAVQSEQAEEFSQELRKIREQRETTQEKAQNAFALQKKELDDEVLRLRDEIKDLPAVRAKNACRALELQRIRKSHAAEAELRNNAAPGIVSLGAALDASRTELSTKRHKLDTAEETQRSALQELQDMKEAQAAELAALAAEVEATVNAAAVERAALQDSLEQERAGAAELRLQDLRRLEERYRPELNDLQRRLDSNRQELQEQQLLVVQSTAELRSMAGEDLKTALDANRQALEELRRTKDDILSMQAAIEESAVRRGLDADAAVKQVEEKAKHQLALHDQSVADEMGIQADRHSRELLRVKRLHEEERRHLQKNAQENELQLNELQEKLDRLDAEVSKRSDEIPKLKADWAVCIENHEKELHEQTEKHASALAEERAQTTEHHDRLRKETAEQNENLAMQVSEAKGNASRIESELKALRATMDQEALEALKDGDAALQAIAELHIKVRAAEEQLQMEREKGHRRHSDVQREVSSLESEHERISFAAGERRRQLQVEVVDTRKQLELLMNQYDQARADIDRRAHEHELKRLRELHMRQIAHENDRKSRALQHKAQVEYLSLNHKAALDEQSEAHGSEQQELLTKLASFKSCIAEMEPAHQAAEALSSELAETREKMAAFSGIRQSEFAKHKHALQHSRTSLVTNHLEELEKDRLRFEEELRLHDLELEKSHGDLQQQLKDTFRDADADLMHGSDLESLRQKAELLTQVHRDGSEHPQASELLESIEQEFAPALSQHIQVVHREVKEQLVKAREDGHDASRLERERSCTTADDKLSQAQIDLAKLKERFQAQLKENELAHRQRLEVARRQASQDAARAANARSDLEKQLAAKEDIARKLRADLETMRQAHRSELNQCNENERKAIEDMKRKEKEAESDLMLEAEEIRHTGEATIQELKDERLRRVEEVRQVAALESDRRAEVLKTKIRNDLWMTQQSTADLQKRFERADKRLEENAKYRQAKLREPIVRKHSNPNLLERRGAADSADPLDDTLNRMVLQLFCRLLAERCSSIVPDEVHRSFDKLHPDFSGRITTSSAELAMEVAHLLGSKTPGSMKEAFFRLDPNRTGKVPDSEFVTRFKQAFNLDLESQGYIIFLIETAAKLLRNTYSSLRTDDGCMSEEEFARIFEDVRLGLVAI